MELLLLYAHSPNKVIDSDRGCVSSREGREGDPMKRCNHWRNPLHCKVWRDALRPDVPARLDKASAGMGDPTLWN